MEIFRRVTVDDSGRKGYFPLEAVEKCPDQDLITTFPLLSAGTKTIMIRRYEILRVVSVQGDYHSTNACDGCLIGL